MKLVLGRLRVIMELKVVVGRKGVCEFGSEGVWLEVGISGFLEVK